MKKHGAEKHRIWRRQHLAIDVDKHKAISAEVSLFNMDDSESAYVAQPLYAEGSSPYWLMEYMALKIATGL